MICVFLFFLHSLRSVASARMSGTQRSQRRARRSWAPRTNLPMSLASLTLCGSHWEPSCNRAATSPHGERGRPCVCLCVCIWGRKCRCCCVCVWQTEKSEASIWASRMRAHESVSVDCLLTMCITSRSAFSSFHWTGRVPQDSVLQGLKMCCKHAHALKTQKWERNTGT